MQEIYKISALNQHPTASNTASFEAFSTIANHTKVEFHIHNNTQIENQGFSIHKPQVPNKLSTYHKLQAPNEVCTYHKPQIQTK